MLPRWHILLGLTFTLIILLLFPSLSLFYVFLILFGSIFIDFDHYVLSVMRTGKFGLHDAFIYHKKLFRIEQEEYAKKIFRKGDFHIFHTIEFHFIVLLLSYVWTGFFFIFIGMLFHSLFDVIELISEKKLYRREFFLVNWLIKRI